MNDNENEIINAENEVRVLILHPDLKDTGGIANYYMKLKNKFTIPVKNFYLGKRPQEKGIISLFNRFIGDYWRFIKEIKRNHYEVIHINPSLSFKGFIREGIFLHFASLYKKKIVVFWRGWHKPFEQKLERYSLWLFKLLYGKSNAFIVLAEDFQNRLEDWGCEQPIYREVTVVDDEALHGFDIQHTIETRMKSQTKRILFLARTVKEKGVYVTIDAFNLLKNKYQNLELVIAGVGEELPKVKAYVQQHKMGGISFPGYLSGEEKFKMLKSTHIFCYPTYYAEGMPNTIMESMAFGLPIITRPVGGVADFFKDGEHGYITESKESSEYARLIEQLLEDDTLYRKINNNNYRFAQENFLASHAALRLQEIYRQIS